MGTKTEKNRSQSSRDNGKKSKGPVSEVGKSVSKMNAVRAGLWCQDIVVEELGESQDEFEEFVGEYMNSFEPHGAAEEMIVHRLAVAEWKMRRAARFEAACIRRQFLKIDRKHRTDLFSLAQDKGQLTERRKDVKWEIKVVEREIGQPQVDWAVVYQLDWSSYIEELIKRGMGSGDKWQGSDGRLVRVHLWEMYQMVDREVLKEFRQALCREEESLSSQVDTYGKAKDLLTEDHQAEREGVILPLDFEIDKMMRYIGPIQRQFNRDFEMLMKLRLFRIREEDASKAVPQITEGWQAEN